MMTLRQRFAAIAVAFWCVAAHGQPAAAPASPVGIPDIPYTKFVLKNGLTLLVHEDHKLPVVAVNTWYHVGSKDERPGKTGFAHLFEHLMFSGSENFNHTYLTALGNVGATSLNGTTSPDRTNYFQTVPTPALDYVLFAESDRMGHLLGVLDQKKLDLQRGVVQNEKRQGENRPYGVVHELLAKNTWPAGHPYSWTTIGAMQDLEAASMGDVREWFQTHYGPNNVTLVLAGDITPETARQKVEQYYGAIPPGPPLARYREWIAKRTGTHRDTVQDRVPQARLYRVWNVPGDHTPAAPLLDLAAQVLGGGRTSRLYQRLVVRDQLATSATAANDGSEIAGQFEMVLTARSGVELARVEQAAAQELQALLGTGPTDAELQRAKTVILAQYARMLERVGGFGGKSDLLAACETYTGRPDCYKTDLQRLQAATPAQVRDAMGQWLADGDYVLAVEPFAAGGASAATLDRNREPIAGAPPPLELPAMRRATLGNGLKLVVAERRGAPVVHFTLLVDSGSASDPPRLPGLAALSLRAMEEGTTHRDSLRLAQELESLGARISTSVNLDGAFVTMNALKATLPAALDLYADVVLHPAFAPADVDRLKQQRVAAIQRDKATPQAAGRRVLPALLYGPEHPYALSMGGDGTEVAVARMTPADLAAYHRAWFKPNNATLLVVGDTSLEELQPMLERAFAGWAPGAVRSEAVPSVAPAAKAIVYLLDRPGAPQSVIHAAQLLPPPDAANAVSLQLLNTVFGGGFSSRINMNLREDKHWSYGTRTEIVQALGQRAYITTAAVQADKTRDALQELAREYAGIAGARPVTREELEAAQKKDALSLTGAFESAEQLGGAYASLLQLHYPERYFQDFAATARAVTPEQSNALARGLIAPEQPVWVIVGDMSKLEAGIRDLKLGEVRRIDADGKEVSQPERTATSIRRAPASWPPAGS